MKRRSFWVVLLALSVAALGCALPGQGQAEQAVDLAATAAAGIEDLADEQAQEAEPPAADDAPDVLPAGSDTFLYQGSSLEQFDTYVARFEMTFDGTNLSGQPATLRMVNDLQGQRDPLIFAMRNEFTGTGIDAVDALPSESGSIYLINTPEKSYFETISGIDRYCIAVPAGGLSDNLDTMSFDVDDFINPEGTDAPELHLVNASEQVNGVETAHYRAENVQTDSNIQNATIDLWYSSQLGYVVRIEMVGDGDIPEFGSGTINVVYDVLSVNQGIEVVIPENCNEFAIPQG